MEKGKRLRVEAEYFWMYYKIPLLAGMLLLAVALCFIHGALAQKESALSVMLVDSHSQKEGEVLAADFARYAEIDTDKYEVSIDSSYLFSDSSSGTYALASLSRFYTGVGTEGLDVSVFLEDDFKTYAKADCFHNLSICLSREQLMACQGKFFYYKGKPVGVYVDKEPGMEENGCYVNDSRAVLGILYNAEHVEQAGKYLEYIMGGE